MKKRIAQLVEKAYHELKEKAKAENEVVKQIYKQVTPTFAADDDGIWAEVDLLEGDPAHRGVAMRNPRFKPFWLKAEAQTSRLASVRKAFSRDGFDLICCQTIACLRVSTCTRSNALLRQVGLTSSRRA